MKTANQFQPSPPFEQVHQDKLTHSWKTQVENACIQSLYENSRAAVLVNTVLAILTATVIWLETDNTDVAFWLVINFITNGFRFYIIQHYPGENNGPEEYQKWSSFFTAGTAMSGMTWGYAAFTFSDPNLPELDVFLVICALGISTGSAMSFYADFKTYIAFCLPTSLPLVAVLAIRGGVTNTTLAVMGLLFVVMLLVTATKSGKMLRTSLEERFRNEALALALERARDESEKANRAKSEFLSSMSHELRTPLTSSLGSLGLLKSISADDLSNEGNELVEIALRNNQTLLRLVNELLDYEKILSGTLEIKTQRHNICDLTSGAVKNNQGYAQSRSISFVFKNHATSLYANVQEYRFEQVLSNLLSNAAKFSEPNSNVEIFLESANGNIFVRVKDVGCGIPEEFRSKIFEQFTQADSSSTRKYGGTGLGLSISKALTESMGGRLEFETEVDVGSTFSIVFPASK